MQNTKIDWCDMTYNPVWGCGNTCEYCYARKIAKRFGRAIAGRDDFEPTFISRNFSAKFPRKPSWIFVNSMSDINYWDQSWVDAVVDRIERNPQHRFMFLTKNPYCYVRLQRNVPDFGWPDNCYLGVSWTGAGPVPQIREGLGGKRFISIEPLMANPIAFGGAEVCDFDWVIVGAETGNRKEKKSPDPEWIKSIRSVCKTAAVPLFEKSSLKMLVDNPLIQTWPEELR